VVIALRGIQKLVFSDPLTKMQKSTRIFQKLGLEQPEVTPGEIAQDTEGPSSSAQRSMSQKFWGVIPEPLASAS
jgi:hypothetical protein